MIVKTTLSISVTFLHQEETSHVELHEATLQGLREVIEEQSDLFSFLTACVMASRTEAA